VELASKNEPIDQMARASEEARIRRYLGKIKLF
jgi:hypothetical protein